MRVIILIISLLLGCSTPKKGIQKDCQSEFRKVVQSHWKPVDFGDWNPKYIYKKDSTFIRYLKEEQNGCLVGINVDTLLFHLGKSIKYNQREIAYRCVDKDDVGLDSILCIRFYFDEDWKMNNLVLQMGCEKAID